jgi:hypothetical protein
VWSWHPGADAKSVVRRARRRRGQQSRSPGRARISVQTIARGRPGCLGRTCGSCPVHFYRTGAMGAASSRPSLRPLIFQEGHDCRIPRAHRAARRRGRVMLQGRWKDEDRISVIASAAKQSRVGKEVWIASAQSASQLRPPLCPRHPDTGGERTRSMTQDNLIAGQHDHSTMCEAGWSYSPSLRAQRSNPESGNKSGLLRCLRLLATTQLISSATRGWRHCTGCGEIAALSFSPAGSPQGWGKGAPLGCS